MIGGQIIFAELINYYSLQGRSGVLLCEHLFRKTEGRFKNNNLTGSEAATFSFQSICCETNQNSLKILLYSRRYPHIKVESELTTHF